MSSSTVWRTSTYEGRVFAEPVVDGELLSDIVGKFEKRQKLKPPGGYGGLVLDHTDFDERGGNVWGSERDESACVSVALLACDCGEVGCWPLLARVTIRDRSVTWQDFTQPHRPNWDYSDFGPFAFERTEYEAAAGRIVQRARLARYDG